MKNSVATFNQKIFYNKSTNSWAFLCTTVTVNALRRLNVLSKMSQRRREEPVKQVHQTFEPTKIVIVCIMYIML